MGAISGTFTIDRKRSTVTMNASSSVHPIHIRSREPEDDLTITDAGATGSLIIRIGTLRTGQPLQDLELRRQLQARRHPSIDATLREVRSVQGDTFEVSGNITFMGTTQPTDGTLVITQAEDELTIRGETTIDVTDFGFRPPNILGVKVNPDVHIEIDLVATRA